MSKFKVGDIVRCTKAISEWAGGPKMGEVFEVLSTTDREEYADSIGIKLLRLDTGYSSDIRNGTRPNWGEGCFELLEGNIKTLKLLYQGTNET